MNYYIDVDIAHRDYRMMSLVFTRIHYALFNHRQRDIGISFPRMISDSLGTMIRLQAPTRAHFEYIGEALEAIERYAHVSYIKKIPDDCRWGIVRQFRSNKLSPSRVRRLIRRGADPKKLEAMEINTPRLHLFSKSSHKPIVLRFEALEANRSHSGVFTSYGLSKDGSTVAMF